MVDNLVAVETVEKSRRFLDVLAFQKMDDVLHPHVQVKFDVDLDLIGYQQLLHLHKGHYELWRIFHCQQRILQFRLQILLQLTRD